MHDLFASWERAGAGDLSTFTEQLAAHRRAGHDRARPRRRRAAPYSPGRRTRRPDAHASGSRPPRPDGTWSTQPVTVAGAETAVDVPADAAVRARPLRGHLGAGPARPGDRRDARRCCPDHRRRAAARRRSGTTCAAPSTTPRSTPPTCSTCSRSAIPVEDTDDAVVLHAAVGDPEGRAARRRDPARPLAPRPRRRPVACSTAAAPGSTIQLAAFQAAVDSAGDAGAAAGLAGGPRPARRASSSTSTCAGGSLVRLAALGAVDRGRARRARSPTSRPRRSRVEHARATASLPDAEAKAWAWQRFTGEVDVPNYELEAAGLGHVARRPGAPHRAVRRPLLRRAARHRRRRAAAGCSPTPPSRSSRSRR